MQITKQDVPLIILWIIAALAIIGIIIYFFPVIIRILVFIGTILIAIVVAVIAWGLLLGILKIASMIIK